MSFFKTKGSQSSSTQPRESSSTQPSASTSAPLSAAIDLFSHGTSSSELAKLTPSERFFAVATKIDLRSREISGDLEWRVFVDLRAEQQWLSHKMSQQKWVEATALYNSRLNQKAVEDHRQFVCKHPRALVDKLAWIEGQALDRISTGKFTCK